MKKAEELASHRAAEFRAPAAAGPAAIPAHLRFRRAHRQSARAGDDPARQDHHRHRAEAEAGRRRAHRAHAPRHRRSPTKPGCSAFTKPPIRSSPPPSAWPMVPVPDGPASPPRSIAELDSAKLARHRQREVRALEEPAEARSRQLHRGPGADGRRRSRAPDRRRLLRAEYRRRPHLPQQARRRHPAGREDVSRSTSRCAAIRSTHASLLRPGPAICSRPRPITWIERAWSPTSPTTATGRRRPVSSPRPAAGGGRGGGGGGGGGGSLQLDGTDTPLESLIGGVERGLLITHFWYIRGVNPADAAADRPDARRRVPDRERKDHHAGDEFPFPRKPGAAAEEHDRSWARRSGCEDWKAGMMIAPALVATDFPLPSISDAI